ncbi:hypothetical protein CH302_00995 [Rhodococcus sp. 15-2388-1-1a]|uniref:hypothetical protein n=1 Tax=Nocardiaceae TaxID=85025 RepID=UPI00056C32A7|nr:MULTISPECIES: hypothetical protein [Rhodococcus]OZF05231.1 hypothetical protein CH302_00995 [Rhodococcus sp. 15-2388-1-1a]
MTNPEQSVIDSIDALIDEQLDAGEPEIGYDFDDPEYPECWRCEYDWHGLPLLGCPGSAVEGPAVPKCECGADWHIQPSDGYRHCPGSTALGPHITPQQRVDLRDERRINEYLSGRPDYSQLRDMAKHRTYAGPQGVLGAFYAGERIPELDEDSDYAHQIYETPWTIVPFGPSLWTLPEYPFDDPFDPSVWMNLNPFARRARLAQHFHSVPQRFAIGGVVPARSEQDPWPLAQPHIRYWNADMTEWSSRPDTFRDRSNRINDELTDYAAELAAATRTRPIEILDGPVINHDELHSPWIDARVFDEINPLPETLAAVRRIFNEWAETEPAAWSIEVGDDDTRTPQQRALPRPSTTPPMWSVNPARARRVNTRRRHR